MAESQAPYNYDCTGAGLIASLSVQRFKPYLVSAGHNQDYAFGLYLYNARMAKAFLFPLQILEVTLRNRINDIFCRAFCEKWCFDHGLRKILSKASLATLDRAINRAKATNTEDMGVVTRDSNPESQLQNHVAATKKYQTVYEGCVALPGQQT
ncbi:hypothetical protein J2125_004606 [Erwinia toletana]|uniref:Uncharacterized protein n=1 Tax=Winslowiella toletana TaxID=92490 RepID=A0ABS4PFI7_9GAMM|nr:hypothetical protein [Winslowiella toletana]